MSNIINTSKQIISRVNLNLRGFGTERKILVIESDDWGSIRMPSKEVYNNCLKAGYPVHLNPFERYDSLASEDDLQKLFNVLSSYTDSLGNHPVITANCVVANPDFEKIRQDNFERYHYELITETFKRYPEHENNFDLWLRAKNEGLFFPQFHAREHLNVSKFMAALQQKDSDVLFAFEHQMPGSIRKGTERNGNYFVEATNFTSFQDKSEKLDIYLDGLRIFEQLFGYKSESVIPTNYIWSNDFNQKLAQNGVKYVQGVKRNKLPKIENEVVTRRYSGQTNNAGQINLVRNCNFEPALSGNPDPVSACLLDIDIAFKMHKPAIINSHRVNYVGFVDPGNRDGNIVLFNELLKRATKRWPDIEFMTTTQLGDLISLKKKTI